MSDKIKKYTNGEVTVVWNPEICIHAAFCAKDLPKVFNPKKRPWVNMDEANTERIVEQIKKCPSGALSYYMNNEEEKIEDVQAENIIEVVKDGPVLIYGNITIKSENGTEKKESKVTALCRCGASNNKPFCDGAHKKINFQG